MGSIIHKHTHTQTAYWVNMLLLQILYWFRHFLTAAIYSSQKIKDARGRLSWTDDKRAQGWGKWEDGGHFLLIWKQRESSITQQVSLTKRQRKGEAGRDREEKRHKCERVKGRSRGTGWVTVVSHPLPQWHRTQSNSPHSWPSISLASRDLVSLPQLNAHPHIINDCFVHRSIKGLFIKSPFASSKIPLLSSLLHLRRWQRLAEFPFRFHVCGFPFFFFFSAGAR